MSVRKLTDLARELVYAPDRGESATGPEPIRGRAWEIPARVDGKRLFLATDENGDLCGIGVMEPGGRKAELSAGLYMKIETRHEGELRIVS